MDLSRETLQQKGIPHLPGDWDFRSEAQQVSWVAGAVELARDPIKSTIVVIYFSAGWQKK